MNQLIQRFIGSNVDIALLRLSVILIFMLFGTYKWFEFEVLALQPIMANSWLNILYELFGVYGASYLLGIVENIAFIALIIGYWQPRAGVLGALIVIATGLTTLSILPQLGRIDSFIVKDILLVGAGLVLLKFDLRRWY